MCEMKGRNGIVMNSDIEWLLKMAEREDGCIVSVGGLVASIAAKEASNQAQAEQSTTRLPHGSDNDAGN